MLGSTSERAGRDPSGETIARRPAQLYEALVEGPVLLVILLVAFGRVRRPGLLAVSLLGLYSLFRFFVEFVREPDEQLGSVAFGWMTMGQFLSLFTILIAAAAVPCSLLGRGLDAA